MGFDGTIYVGADPRQRAALRMRLAKPRSSRVKCLVPTKRSIWPFLASRTCATTASSVSTSCSTSSSRLRVEFAWEAFLELASAGIAPGTTVIAPARPTATEEPFRNLRRSKPSISSPLELAICRSHVLRRRHADRITEIEIPRSPISVCTDKGGMNRDDGAFPGLTR